MTRLFFALSPADAERRALTDALPADLGAERVIPPANFHVTLAFLGNLDEAQAARARELAAEVSAPPFALRFTELAFWRRPRLRVLLPDTVPEAAHQLRAGLAWALRAHGIPFDARNWRPHVTVARRAWPRELSVSRPVSVPFDDYVLMRSGKRAGIPVYEPVARWPLVP